MKIKKVSLILFSTLLLTFVGCSTDVETKLTAPTNLVAKLSETALNTINLTWDAVDGIDYYWIYYSTENDVSRAKTSISLSESGTYYFWVKSANTYYSDDAITSDFSESVSFTY